MAIRPEAKAKPAWERTVLDDKAFTTEGPFKRVPNEFSTLDRAAMETVRLACPIHMKQALSAAEVAVYVPIVYSLAG